MNNMNEKEKELPEEEVKNPENIETEEIKESVEENETAPDENESEETEEEKLQRENAELKDKLLRSIAEFDNYRKRTIQEKASWIKNATEQLVLKLCDVQDNFERAINAGAEENQFESFMKGVKMIHDQFNNILSKEGVKKVETVGKEFDPQVHEALSHIPSEYDENIVAAVIQNGYTMNDKLIRPAQVAVSSGKIEK
ncbi:MAG: nucleotide exchange factor GrpE [Candidatus Cloacimonadota bacterium]|nr:MAG: nucleotide exchange factor GrpE [Candidatus Cloacimonadota bacterium]